MRFDAGLSVFLKRHYHLPWPSRLAALVRPGGRHTPASAEWAHLERARGLGIAVPEVVAVGDLALLPTARGPRRVPLWSSAIEQAKVAARALGVATAAFEDALRYAQERESFGKPIWQHQAIGHHLAGMGTKITAARQLILHAAERYDAGERSDMEAGMAKLYASEMAMEVALDAVRVLTRNGVPVMGHVGLLPQTATAQGGLRVQGKDDESARRTLQGALDLQEAGAFAAVLEAIPARLARLVTERLQIPTIGIGAGVHCGGQVLVYHDLLGLYEGEEKKLAKRYAELGRDAREAIAAYAAEVRAREFPTKEHSFVMKDEVLDKLY